MMFGRFQKGYLITQKQPQRRQFIDPFNHQGWLSYFAEILPRFQYIRFLGLPSLKDTPDVLLNRLYVPIYLGTSYLAWDDLKKKEEELTIQDILEKNRYLVLLGDPGSGKSTLVNYLTTLFASRKNHLLADSLGNMIPIPFILRDLKIDEHITFEGLLEQFITQPFWKEQLLKNDLMNIMQTGQALIFLDGLDEIGDINKRKALRTAIMKGVTSYPRSIWLMTSRVIGYEDVPFDLPREEIFSFKKLSKQDEFLRSFLAGHFVSRFYILPLNREQIQSFIEKWYNLREADGATRKECVKSLMNAISASPSIESLAHNPNLLTMMALIHRVYAKLPSGRALLYEKITEAYIESIDEYRKIHGTKIRLEKQREWLAQLAYEMQKKRSKKKSNISDILIPTEKVKEMMKLHLGEDYDIERELSYIARRSGLLLPRKPGFYNFVHLSFQEYFAALFLYEGLISFNRREKTLEIIGGLKDIEEWHEGIIFLFEMLSRHSGASDQLFERLFLGQNVQTLAINPVLLAAELLSNLHSGLGSEKRHSASTMVLNFSERQFSENLAKKINFMPQEIWTEIFMLALEEYLNNAAQKRQTTVSPDLTLFLQNLIHLDFKKLDTLLERTVLSSIKGKDLYYLYNIAYLCDGPVRKHMVERMPIELWFVSYSGTGKPISSFERDEIQWNKFMKRDLLTWCCSIEIIEDAFMVKIILITPDFNLDRTRDRDLESAWARARALLLAQDGDPNSAWARARGLAGARERTRAWARDWDWDPNSAWARDQALDLTLNVLMAWAWNRDHAVDWAWDRASDLTLDLASSAKIKELPFALQVVRALFSGNDQWLPPAEVRIPSEILPLQLILQKIAQLVLGINGVEAVNDIQDQVRKILDPGWVKRNLPFLQKGELDTILNFLGLHPEREPFLFKANLFTKHKLAKAINAKPSQFVKVLKRELKKPAK